MKHDRPFSPHPSRYLAHLRSRLRQMGNRVRQRVVVKRPGQLGFGIHAPRWGTRRSTIQHSAILELYELSAAVAVVDTGHLAGTIGFSIVML